METKNSYLLLYTHLITCTQLTTHSICFSCHHQSHGTFPSFLSQWGTPVCFVERTQEQTLREELQVKQKASLYFG